MGGSDRGPSVRPIRARDDGVEPIGLFTHIARRPGTYGIDSDQFRSFTAYVDGYMMGNRTALAGLDDWLLDRIAADVRSLVWWARIVTRYEETTGLSWNELPTRDQMWFVAFELDTYLATKGITSIEQLRGEPT